MKYDVVIRTPLQWLIGDKPDVTGLIQADGGTPNLLGATWTLTRPFANEALVEERIVDSLNANGDFVAIAPTQFTQTNSGNALIAALVNSGATATLDVGINASDTTVAVTGSSIPASGNCLIDTEWMQYTISGTTLTFVKRGIFRTTAAIHAINAEVKFSAVKETALPYYEYQVLRTDLIPQTAT